MRTYMLAPIDQNTGETDLERVVDLTEDDVQDIVAALVTFGRPAFAAQIAERLAPEETL